MIEGGALTVPLLNETEWHVSEIAVALTVIRKPTTEELEESESHTEKRPDENRHLPHAGCGRAVGNDSLQRAGISRLLPGVNGTGPWCRPKDILHRSSTDSQHPPWFRKLASLE